MSSAGGIVADLSIPGKLLYKSDGTTSRFSAGVEDFCGAGCLLVKEIRVPFPDCSTHGDPFFASTPR